MQLSKRTAQISPFLLFLMTAATALLISDLPSARAQLGDEDCDWDGCLCGDCDDASERNLWNPLIAHPMVIKTKMLIFAHDDTTNLAVSDTLRDAQIDQLNQDFQAYGIEFDIDPDQVNDTCYRHMCNVTYLSYCNSSQLRYDDETPPVICCDSWWPQSGCDLEDYQEVQMKNQYAEEGKLNIFITSVVLGGDWAVYPWSSRAATKTGGVMKEPTGVGAQTCGVLGDDHCTWLTHEVGHALGLRHTFDIPEGGGSSECDEPASCTGSVSCSTCNHLGDMCCDTPSSEYEDDLTNYMSYGGEGVSDQFTTQQARRMHCWICNTLPEWIDSPDCNENDMPDVCEITRGLDRDCDEDDILDNGCETAAAAGACCLSNYPDDCIRTPTSACCDSAGGLNWYGLTTKCEDIDCSEGPMGPQGP